MAWMTACRKARAWQRQFRVLSSLDFLCYDSTLPAISCLQIQRFHSSNTSSLPVAAVAAVAAAQGGSAASASPTKRGRKKRGKFDEIGFLEAETRIFDMSLGTEEDLIDGEIEIEGTRDSSDSSQPIISSELKTEYNERLAGLDKRRKRIPLMEGETLESWFTKHKQELQPFLAFLQHHGADQRHTVAELYNAGYWGRKIMLPPTSEDEDDFQQLFSDWEYALKKEDVHLTAADLLHRWPCMLTRQPFKLVEEGEKKESKKIMILGTTLATLRAALPEDGSADIQDLIRKAPMILGVAPLEMQKRLVKLQFATEREAGRMLVSYPMLLTNPLDDIFSNLRLVREYSRSPREFKSFLYTSAAAVGKRPFHLLKYSIKIRRVLERVLPPGVNAVELIKAKPQLLLVRVAWLRQRWEAIEDAVQLMDEWKEEFRNLVEDCAAMPASSTHKASSSFSDDILSLSPPPEWIDKDMDPKSLGVKLNQTKSKIEEIRQLDEDSSEESTDNNETLEDEDDTIDEAVRDGRKAYSALSEALYMRRWRIQRLEYMAEQVPEEAARVSFVSAMAVTLEQFEERFPEFHDWEIRKQEERDKYQEEEEEGTQDVVLF